MPSATAAGVNGAAAGGQVSVSSAAWAANGDPARASKAVTDATTARNLRARERGAIFMTRA